MHLNEIVVLQILMNALPIHAIQQEVIVPMESMASHVIAIQDGEVFEYSKIKF